MCALCEKESKESFCETCSEMLKRGIGLKCTKCGSYGFVSREPRNLMRLSFFIPSFKELTNLHEVTVVPTNGCPDCANFKGKVREGLIQ